MEGQSTNVLSSLQEFIAKQEQLLQRTKSDIGRLRTLRADIQQSPTSVLYSLSNELNDAAYKLSADANVFTEVPSNILERCKSGALDPIPLNTLASTSRAAYAQRNQPHTCQRSELSDLQKLVKNAKRRLIEPVFDELARLGYLPTPDDEAELAELARAKERAKAARMHERTIKFGGLRVPTRPQVDDVIIRRDVEDESGVVDISLDEPSGASPHTSRAAPQPPSPMMLDTPLVEAKPSRARRPATKVRDPSPPLPPPKKKAKVVPETVEEPSEPKPVASASKRSRDGKPKPETYKQAWSMEEQHELERLLDEIPDGEKNRWQKISRAMNGRRTPRQVASRVQKYFEKLKRLGVEEP
ncbi:hypothetical protein HGRIS_012210 [Hohenbuehelia grisea]|uniref:Uncharacterized protein n=1 Tax=Hohenbuehelia grisea TaxID=104357 RepID=A0ABR3IRP4_9AGAR